MFFSLAYMQFLGLAECAETMMRLPVFYKQKFALFYPAWAYAVPFALIRIPITLIEVTFWAIVVYWLVGLEADAGRFFTFWGILFTLQLYSSSFYRLIGSTVRAIVTGTSVAVVAMLVTLAGSGFLLLQDQIRPWWIWMFWCALVGWSLLTSSQRACSDVHDHVVRLWQLHALCMSVGCSSVGCRRCNTRSQAWQTTSFWATATLTRATSAPSSRPTASAARSSTTCSSTSAASGGAPDGLVCL